MFLSKIAGFHSLQTFYSTRATKSDLKVSSYTFLRSIEQNMYKWLLQRFKYVYNRNYFAYL